MSRLAAQARGLYYPTELRVIAGIANILELRWLPSFDVERNNSETLPALRVLDPAAGTGRALACLLYLLQRNYSVKPLAANEQMQASQTPLTLAIESYGIELATSRASEGKEYLNFVLNTDAKTAKVSDRSFDLVFCNPPYDDDRLNGQKRLEQSFLMKCTKVLRPGGYLIWIIPQRILQENAEWLASFYKDHIVRQFPHPEKERFGQIVVVAQRKAAKLPNEKRADELRAMARGELEIKTLACPNLEEFQELLQELKDQAGIYGPEIEGELIRLKKNESSIETVGVPAKSKAVITPTTIKNNQAFAPLIFAYGEYHAGEALLEAAKNGVWGNTAKRELLYLLPSRAMVIKNPLMPMRIGFTSQFIQIGLADNMLLTNHKRKVAVKGKTVKKWKTVAIEYDEKGNQAKRIDREVITSEIKTLDLTTGEVETLDSAGLGKLVEEFKEAVQHQMLVNYPPLYVPLPSQKRVAEVGVALAAIAQNPELAGKAKRRRRRRLRREATLIQRLEQGLRYLKAERRPLGGQRLGIVAAALALSKYGYATLEAEMGTGKTPMGVAAAYLAGARRILVVCPTTLLEKWVREVKATVEGAEAVIVNNISDLERVRYQIVEHERVVKLLYNNRPTDQPYPPFFIIMSKEQLKLESGWEPAVVYHPPRGETVRRTGYVKSTSKKIVSQNIGNSLNDHPATEISGDNRANTLSNSPKITSKPPSQPTLHKKYWGKDWENGPHYPRQKDGKLVRDFVTGKLLMWPHCPRCDAPVWGRNGKPVSYDDLADRKTKCKECGEALWQRKSKLVNSGLRTNWELQYRQSNYSTVPQNIEEEAGQLKQALISEYRKASANTSPKSTPTALTIEEEAGRWLSLYPYGGEAYRKLVQMFLAKADATTNALYAKHTPKEWEQIAALVARTSYRKLGRSIAECEYNGDGWESVPQYRDSQPTGYRKVKLSQYVQRRMPHFFDLAIIDEIHQMKAKGSGQGVSAGRVAMACGKVLTLTGTFADGYSTNVMHLLWRFTDPAIRKQWGRHETGRWAKKYGIIKATRTGRGGPPADNEDFEVVEGRNSDREIGGKTRFEEAPGISPAVALLTIPHTVYLQLSDVTKDLPPYREFPNATIPLRYECDGVWPVPPPKPVASPSLATSNPVVVIDAGAESLGSELKLSLATETNEGAVISKGTKKQKKRAVSTNRVGELPANSDPNLRLTSNEKAGKPLPSQAEAYYHLADKLTQELKVQLARGSTRLLGAMVHSLLAWLDNPTKTEIVQDPKTKAVVATAPALPAKVIYPKEQKLINLYRQVKAAGQKLLIYIAYTDTRDMAPRLKWVLEQADQTVRVAVMGSGEAKKREGWIAKQVASGCDVLITHPKKVEVGLDLLEFPVIVFYNVYYVTQTIEQAKKRAWRIGQEASCQTHFWAYGSTAQERGLRHVARKIYAAAKLKGQIVDAGITELLGDDEEESVLRAIAKAITREENSPTLNNTDGNSSNNGEDALEATLEKEVGAMSLEELMNQTLAQEMADAAFVLTSGESTEEEVETAINHLYQITFNNPARQETTENSAKPTLPNQQTSTPDKPRIIEGSIRQVKVKVTTGTGYQSKPSETAKQPDNLALYSPENRPAVAQAEKLNEIPETTNPITHSRSDKDISNSQLTLPTATPANQKVEVVVSDNQLSLEEFRGRLLQERQHLIGKRNKNVKGSNPTSVPSLFDF